MPVKKHDYAALKLEFFESEDLTVKEFIRRRFGEKRNGEVENKMKGWTEEKKNYLKEVYRKARSALMTEKAAKWQAILEKVEDSEMKGVEDLIEKIESKGAIMDVKDLIVVLKHFRVVQGKPAEIAQNLNVNTDADRDDDAKAHVAKMLGIKPEEV